MRLSDTLALTLPLPAGKHDFFVWDEGLPGFALRIRSSGRRSWAIQYRLGRQQRRESLGDIRRVRIEDARRIARQRFAQVELGIDPVAERVAARVQAGAQKLTLGVVAERYLAAKKHALRASTHKAAERYFAVQWESLRGKPIDTIKRADVAATLQEIIKTNGRTSAARARGNLSALFGWALREGLCEANPVIGTNDPAEGIRPRERVLSDGEIRVIWSACQDDDFGRIIKLLLLTGCRRDEIGGLLWNEVDLNSGVMTLPGTRTKNHRTLELTLPPAAIDILRSAPRRAGREYVFGGRGGAFSAWSYSTLRLNARIAKAEGAPLAGWRLHDLRRTMRTGMGQIGVPPHIAELVINHVKHGVEAVYDKYRYQAEIKTALARWAAHVASIIEGHQSNVTALQRA